MGLSISVPSRKFSYSVVYIQAHWHHSGRGAAALCAVALYCTQYTVPYIKPHRECGRLSKNLELETEAEVFKNAQRLWRIQRITTPQERIRSNNLHDKKKEKKKKRLEVKAGGTFVSSRVGIQAYPFSVSMRFTIFYDELLSLTVKYWSSFAAASIKRLNLARRTVWQT